MRFTLTLILLLLFAQQIHAQESPSPEGYWEGSIELPGQALGIEVELISDGEWSGTISIPLQGAADLALTNIYVAADSVAFDLQAGAAMISFRGKMINDDLIEGTFIQAGMQFPFSLERGEKSEEIYQSAFQTEEIVIEAGDLKIAGTLQLTEQDSSQPIVILISGSGAQDRDETIFGFKPFRILADSMASIGFASFRYDDRGIGGSNGNTDATLNELSDDLLHVIRYLKEDERIDSNRVFLLGHSQGGILAGIATFSEDIAGVILMATPVLPGFEIINQQIKEISSRSGISGQIIEQNLELQNQIYEAIRRDEGLDEVREIFEERIRQQLTFISESQIEAMGGAEAIINAQVEQQLAPMKSRWFRSFMDYDPAEDLKYLEIPVLAVFGEKDVQVLPSPNIKEINSWKTENLAESFRIQTIAKANHLFQESVTGMPQEYATLEKVFAPGFIQSLNNWLLEVTD
jgi:pimeloyl-ACP methyl ester carboxylesterase